MAKKKQPQPKAIPLNIQRVRVTNVKIVSRDAEGNVIAESDITPEDLIRQSASRKTLTRRLRIAVQGYLLAEHLPPNDRVRGLAWQGVKTAADNLLADLPQLDPDDLYVPEGEEGQEDFTASTYIVHRIASRINAWCELVDAASIAGESPLSFPVDDATLLARAEQQFSEVVDLVSPPSDTPSSAQPPRNGIVDGGLWWDGKFYKVAGVPLAILKLMWSREYAPASDAKSLWDSPIETQTVTTAVNRLNGVLAPVQGFPWHFTTEAGAIKRRPRTNNAK